MSCDTKMTNESLRRNLYEEMKVVLLTMIVFEMKWLLHLTVILKIKREFW